MEHVFKSTGLNPVDYQGFRLSIRYPQIPTAADLQWKLPQGPKGFDWVPE
jgi:hypothetical protein